jgi:hypothetical protein
MKNMLTHIIVAPGLLKALQSELPPTIDFFKGLPTHSKNLWGVCLILLRNSIYELGTQGTGLGI